MFNIFKRKTQYMNYDSYKAKIDFISEFSFQQKVRNNNIKNILGF